MPPIEWNQATFWNVLWWLSVLAATLLLTDLWTGMAKPWLKNKWASREEIRAQKRARQLVSDYIRDYRLVRSERRLMLELSRRQSTQFATLLVFIAQGVTLMVLWLEFDFLGSKALASPAIGVWFVLVFAWHLRWNRRIHDKFDEMIRRPDAYRNGVADRLKAFLQSANISEDDIKTWIGKLPKPVTFTKLHTARAYSSHRLRNGVVVAPRGAGKTGPMLARALRNDETGSD